jgi:UDP-glucose 4-epimerase
VGSACLRWLLRHGHEAWAYDNLSEGNAAAVPQDRLIRGDILDRAALGRALEQTRADAVMHFAASASVPESLKDPELYWRNNLLGTKTVLDAMLERGISRIVFSSTAATYAFDVEMPIREDSLQKPQTPYGTSKLAAEWLIKDYARATHIGYAMLRYFNASGADEDGEHGEDRRSESHLIPLTLYAALGRIPKLRITGTDFPTPDGSAVRDYVHTDDLAQAHQLCLESLGPDVARVYNLGTGTGYTVRQVLGACEKVVGRPIPHESAPRRPGDPAVLIASPAAIKRDLGWAPKHTSIDSVVRSAWAWHSRHPNGYGAR